MFLRERGFRVFVVPEAATIGWLNGCSPDDFSRPGCAETFQDFVIATQISLENSFFAYARSVGVKSVVLCDRGLMDGSAYVDESTWSNVLKRYSLDVISAREGRYNAVFHLVTAADGAESFYSLSNNKGRSENLEEAKVQDKKTQKAWSGHAHHVIIDNRHGRSFEKKMERLLSMLAVYVGLPSLHRGFHKYNLVTPPNLALLPHVQIFDVEKIMLSDGVGSQRHANTSDQVLYSFVRRRSQGGFHAYGLTTVKLLESGEKVELKQVISARMYSILSNSADPTRDVVKQRRYCFLWEQQSCHIYEYLEPNNGIWTLLCQSEGEPILPPFINVGPLLPSSGGEFSSREISLKEKPC